MELIKSRKDFAKVINEMGLKKGVEVGVAKGEFSEYLLQNSNLETLYSIDAWDTNLKLMKAYRLMHTLKNVDMCYEKALKKLSRFGNRSVIIRDLSENAVKEFEDESLDFIYLDASHLFSGFTIDLINWWEKLKWNGLFAGHDFIRKLKYQISYAINGFCMEHKQFYYLTINDIGSVNHNIPSPSWWLIKTKRNRTAWAKEFEEYKSIITKQAKILKKTTKIDIMYECLGK